MFHQPTEQQVREALEANATRIGDDRWAFASEWPHTERQARAIVELCLTLGQPVTDIPTGEMMLTVVRSVADLQRQLDTLASTLFLCDDQPASSPSGTPQSPAPAASSTPAA